MTCSLISFLTSSCLLLMGVLEPSLCVEMVMVLGTMVVDRKIVSVLSSSTTRLNSELQSALLDARFGAPRVPDAMALKQASFLQGVAPDMLNG